VSARKRVLVVDDEPDVLDSLVMALEGAYDVDTARDGRAAIAMLQSAAFDVVVLDLVMPVMSGEEVLGALAGRPHPPIIVSSASRNLPDTCARFGVTHCLQKPYRLGLLHEKLAAVLDGDRARPA